MVPRGEDKRAGVEAGQLVGDVADKGVLEGDAIERWRASVFDRLSLVCFAVISLIGGVLALQAAQTKEWGIAASVLSITPFLAAAAWVHRLGRPVRVGLLVSSVLYGCWSSLLHGGFWAPNAFIAMTMVVTLLSVCVPARYAWGALLAFCLTIVAAGERFLSGATLVRSETYALEVFPNWLRISLIFGLATAGCVVAVTFLTRRLEQAVQHNGSLFRGLQLETQQRVQAIEARQVLELQLNDSSKVEALGRMASGVAHDFNNLLVVILSNASLMLEELGEAAPEELKDIELAGERAAELTRQLLLFGRQGVTEAIWLEVDIALTASLKMIRRLLPSNIEVTLGGSSAGSWVRVAEVEMDQILMNLCINARDAMPAGGRLQITTSSVQRAPAVKMGSPPTATPSVLADYVCIRVEDSGTGMSADDQARIFEPFFTTKEVGKGTGLGLSVVLGAVEQRGGFVEVDSKVGKGTAFAVFLPANRDAKRPERNLSPQLDELGGQGELLLVVEDNQGVRQVLEHVLSSAGYRVLVCENGQRALEAFQSDKAEVQLVLTDSIMPQMGGRELYDRLHEQAPELPFLFCSAYTSSSLPPGFFDDPLRGLIAKPFRHAELLLRVRELLLAAAAHRGST